MVEAPVSIEQREWGIKALGNLIVLEVLDEEGTAIEEDEAYYPGIYPEGEDVTGLQGHEKLVKKLLSNCPLRLQEINGEYILTECFISHRPDAGTELPDPDIVRFQNGEVKPGNIISKRTHGLCKTHVKTEIERCRREREAMRNH